MGHSPPAAGPRAVCAPPGAERIAWAVAWVNARKSTSSLRLAREIGDFVVREFFGGDPKHFRRRGRSPSFRALATHPDLKMSHSALFQAVAVSVQVRALPAEIADRLTFSHHRALLPVRSEEAKLALARQAADEGLTCRQLAERVRAYFRQESAASGRTGRPAMPQVVKRIRQMRRIARSAAAETPDIVELHQAGLRHTETVVSELDELIDSLSTLRHSLYARVHEARLGKTPFK